MTGHSVSRSNSVEFAPCIPATWRANSRRRSACRGRRPGTGSRARGRPDRADLALDPPAAEAAGDEDAVGAGEALPRPARRSRATSESTQSISIFAAVEVARVPQRLRRPTGRRPRAGRTCRPGRSARAAWRRRRAVTTCVHSPRSAGCASSPQRLDDELVDALLVVPDGHLVDVVDVLGRHHRVDGQRGEEGDLLADVEVQRGLRAAEQHVGLDADAAQLVDRVLRRLRLQLARVADVGHEREVDEEAVPPADVDRELADRLEEGQRLDVAHRPADLGDDDVDVARARR